MSTRTTIRHLRRHEAIGRACCEVLEGRELLSFTPAVNYPVGTNPLAVVTADFNNDGRLDVATANTGGISVLLGDGAGGFGAAIGTAPGYHAEVGDFQASLAVADFNKDGNLDLAMGYYGVFGFDALSGVGVALGNGQGGFAWIPQQFGMGYAVPHSVVVGDFNNDGNSDLVVFGEYDSFGLYGQWFGNGRGGFTAYGAVQLSLPSYGQAASDLNADGYLDVVGADGTMLLNDGNGSLQPGFFGSSVGFPLAVAVGDFSSDGVPDLVVTGGIWWGTSGVDTLIGLGNGTFDVPVTQPDNGGEHTGVAVTDFNGDGKLDAVTSDADTGTVSELLGNGDGTLRFAGAFATGTAPSGVAVGDFNGDDRPDVATANQGSNNVSVLLNDGTWQTPPPAPPDLTISDVTVTEGNAGTRSATFTLTLSKPASVEATVHFTAANITAQQGIDFDSTSGMVVFAAGQTSKTITVAVKGDRLPEPSETFALNLLSPTNLRVADAQGIGTIVDDEPRISIGSVSKSEGNTKTTTFSFTVSLGAAYDQAVTVNYATAEGTATAGSDYQAKSGSVTFAPGETIKTITIVVNADKSKEANETFFVDLLGASSNAQTGVARGIGTILDDDRR